MKGSAVRKIAIDDVERARQAWHGGAGGQARKLLNRHLERFPRDTRALHLRAMVALGQGAHDEAIELMGKAVALEPDNPDFWCDYGTALHGKGEREPAREAYLRALALRADHLDAVFNLANVLRELKQLKDALQFYSALLERNPDYRHAWNNTGLALLDLGHLEEARKCFAREIELDSTNVNAYVNLGHVLRELGRVEDAIAIYRQGLALSPRYPELHLNLGVALTTLGEVRAAATHLREALKLRPGYDTAHHSLIFTLDFDAQVTTRMQQEARRAWYRECVQAKGQRPGQPLRDTGADRRLRVGYVSADFRVTSAAMTFSPMLFHYDREKFEVYCYSNSVHEDRLTERIRGQCAGYRFIGGMTDAQAARQISQDRIDILVDLSGHMQGNRLGLFARKPAPLQITAWGYANGSGVAEMDYILADANYLPDDDIAHFAERRLDVPSVIPYHPFETLPQLPALPVAIDAPLRLGCFSRWQKLSGETLSLWAEVLTRLPEAELVLKASQELDQRGIDGMRSKFVALGVDPARIRFLPRGGWVSHLESFAQIDIQLDPYPHGGGISLLDGLAMGVPSLTLEGSTPPARLGSSLLRAVGVGEGWIARSREEYLELAARCSTQCQALRAQRHVLREKLLNSSVGDTGRYAGAVEQAYLRAWRDRVPALEAGREQALCAARDALLRSDPTSANAALQPLLEGCTESAEVLQLAGVAAMQVGASESALAYFRRALSLDPDCAEGWVNQGVLLTQNGRIEEAIAAMQRAIELQPEQPEHHYNLGCAWLKIGDRAQAGSCFERVIALRPEHALATNNLGVLKELAGDAESAERLFRRALQLQPDNGALCANVGRLLVEREAFEEAIPYFERALLLKPDLHWLRYELAVWYERLGYHGRLPTLWKDPFKPGTALPSAKPGSAFDARIFARITGLIRASHARSGHAPAELSGDLLEICGRLMEIDHPAKNLLLDEAIALDPGNPKAYQSAGISLHHDGEYAAAAMRWQQGLRQRDALAREADVLEHPHRVLDTSWYMAVGHMQLLDIYLKSVELGMRPRKTLWMLRTKHHKVPNQAYLDYWRPWIRMDAEVRGSSNLPSIAHATGLPQNKLGLITDHFFADRVEGRHELWHMEFAADVQRRWEARGAGPLLQLSPQDMAFGRETLERMGVPQDAWFVCVHVREPGFWGKWDRFHPSIRNARIDDYQMAIDQIVARGGWVIRMGDRSMAPLSAREGVVDYAHSPHKSERMDVFLCGAARLFVGVNSGISLLPPTFGVPCLLTNFVPISIPFPYGRDRMLPKLFRSNRDGRLVTFAQMFECRVANAQFARHVPDWMTPVDNDPADIAEAVNEMLDENEGKLSVDECQASLAFRTRYDDILRAQGNFIGSPLGGRFLQRYEALLR